MFRALPVVIFSAAFLVACTVRAVAQTNQSVQELQQKAAELPKTFEGNAEAITVYQSLIGAHLDNERAFTESLRELATRFEESGQADAGVRYFMGLIDTVDRAENKDAMRQAISEFFLKHREQVERIFAEHQGASAEPANPIEAIPLHELRAAILQREDVAVREAALAKLREMLAPNRPDTEKVNALATLQVSLSAKFDRAGFLTLVRPLLAAQDEQLRVLALRCLPGLEATADDLGAIASLAADPSSPVRAQVALALVTIGKGERGDIVVPAMIRLLQDADETVVEANLRSIWGQYATPELDEVLIKLSYDPRHHGNAIYHGLSTLRSKSAAVCRRLVEVLDEPDWNDSGRAAWGLTYGVADEAKALVEEGLLRALAQETNPYTRKQEFTALRQVATAKSREYIRTVSESDLETDEFRQLARDVLAELETRQ